MYRAYLDEGALNLVHLGAYTPLIDHEMCRRLDPSHWSVKTADTFKTWMIGAGGVAVTALGVLGLALSRAAFRERSKALELVSLLLGVAGIAIPFVILFVGGTIWRITRRVRQLDAMNPEELRQEAVKGKSGLHVKPQELTDVTLQPLAPGGGLGVKPIARLTFKHPSSGTWKLNLYTSGDVKLAAGAMRQMAGPGQLTIDPSLA